MPANPYETSSILIAVREWLRTDKPRTPPCGPELVKIHILKAATMLGFGPPFDREQRALNALLFEARATKTQCFSAWGYYYDCKLIEASQIKAPAPPQAYRSVRRPSPRPMRA